MSISFRSLQRFGLLILGLWSVVFVAIVSNMPDSDQQQQQQRQLDDLASFNPQQFWDPLSLSLSLSLLSLSSNGNNNNNDNDNDNDDINNNDNDDNNNNDNDNNNDDDNNSRRMIQHLSSVTSSRQQQLLQELHQHHHHQQQQQQQQHHQQQERHRKELQKELQKELHRRQDLFSGFSDRFRSGRRELYDATTRTRTRTTTTTATAAKKGVVAEDPMPMPQQEPFFEDDDDYTRDVKWVFHKLQKENEQRLRRRQRMRAPTSRLNFLFPFQRSKTTETKTKTTATATATKATKTSSTNTTTTNTTTTNNNNNNNNNHNRFVRVVKPKQHNVTKPKPKLLLPTPIIVMGFPKAGTSSIFTFFQQQGLRSQHWYCCGDQTSAKSPGRGSGGSLLMADCLLHNLKKKHNHTKIKKQKHNNNHTTNHTTNHTDNIDNRSLFQDCGNFDVYSEINGARKSKTKRKPFNNNNNNNKTTTTTTTTTTTIKTAKTKTRPTTTIRTSTKVVTGYLMDDGSFDYDGPGKRIFFPQHFNIHEIHEAYPNATWILNWRDVGEWIKSVLAWAPHDKLHYQFLYEYYQQGEIQKNDLPSPNNENITHIKEILSRLYLDHFAMVRTFVKDHPSHALIEVNITDANAGKVLADAFGLNAKGWKNMNHNNKKNKKNKNMNSGKRKRRSFLAEAVRAATGTSTGTSTTRGRLFGRGSSADDDDDDSDDDDDDDDDDSSSFLSWWILLVLATLWYLGRTMGIELEWD